MSEPKKTPLYDAHIEAGGKIVDFSGWLLPINYPEGIIAEHHNTRNEASVFDVSHMGEILVTGPGAYDYVSRLCTNDLSKVKKGRVVYTVLCYENGTCVDDLLVYPWRDEGLFLVVNAANDDKDYEWIKTNAPGDVTVTHVSHLWGQVALQGPGAAQVMTDCGMDPCNALKFFESGFFSFGGVECVVSKTGYTGEKGFEIYMPWDSAPQIWKILIEKGAKPAGLGCRDTLRFEAGLPLYGHEISDTITPLEGGLDFFVKTDKPGGFIGDEALRLPQPRKQIGLEFLGKGIPRAGFEVLADGKTVGVVTTGSPSPTTGKRLALAIVDRDASPEAEYAILVRGKAEAAALIPTPFYKRSK